MPPKKRTKKVKKDDLKSSDEEVSSPAGERVNPDELKDFLMNMADRRLETFLENNWPFQGDCCTCNPEKMAEAGFYHCPTENEPDLVKCFMCCKELDGWEPEDNPWEEHKAHSSECLFLKGKKDQSMTIRDFLKLEAARQTMQFDKCVAVKLKEFQEYAEQAQQEILKLLD